ncbi:substrate-binding domain-containing protein [Anaerocolumna chitinilytica]|uniref:Sugar ABC transporter substrate-binding protein n=1 Tax=Anaerocolumna chitinilytica TaxID=1727145 RepID=A0A7I8DM92_9FIRM|nr:sugar-binding protein [Anaerocolumna chitinilytica]BCJ99499.1 sugar ABC transporter substrate-binding protein [Anaerocolumna chitinilytica]
MKKMIAVLLCLMMVVSLAGCGTKDSSGSKGGKVDVGIVLPTKDEPRWLQDKAKFEEVIKKSNKSVEVLFSQGSSANEKTNVETLINKGIKVLIICAQDAAAAAETVKEAKDAGITVIAYDRLITGTDAVDYYVTFDSLAVGAAMGQYLADNATGTGNPLYLYAGAATDNNAFLFFQGAWNILQPKIADGTFVIKNSSEAVGLQATKDLSHEQLASIIGQVTTNWDFNEAKSKAEAHLTAVTAADKGKCYVLAPNDGTARSIADVFAADADVSQYFITGQDSEKASVQYVIDGKQSMTVFKDTRTLATDAMNMAISVIDGKTPATDTTYNNGNKDVPAKQTPIVVVTKDNVKAALIDSGYYQASDFTGLQ